MTFSFQPPAAAPFGTPIPGQATPAQALAGATAPAAQNIEQAIAASLQGASQIPDRHPELPPGGQFDLTLVDIRAQNDRQTGLGYYIDVQVNAASGVNVPVGTICTAKIRGFNNPDTVQFAIRDIRAFARASLAKVNMRSAAPVFSDAPDLTAWSGQGVPMNWIGDDQRWTQLCIALVTQKPIVGQRLFCKSDARSSTKVQGRKPKTVYEWFAAA